MANENSQESQLVLQTVQWTKLQKIEELEPIGEQDYEVLREIREVLVRHGHEKRFGVCLLHKHFDLLPGEAALEESDEAARVSTITVVPEKIAEEAMETAWSFTQDAEITAGRKCRVYCKGFGLTGHSRKHECAGFDIETRTSSATAQHD
jgi:hypothetical protein